jgi:hypothetical protein
LYLEAHPPLMKAPAADTDDIDEPSTAADATESEPVVADGSLTELTRAYVAATATRKGDVRWDLAEAVLAAARGLPELVSVAAPVPLTESFAADPAAATP